MPISKINTFGIADNAVISSKIAQDVILAEDIDANAVTVNELANNAVTSAKIVDGTIITTDLANDAVETINIKDLNVTTAKIEDNAITVDKIADNAVTLGTHTTGNYMVGVSGTTNLSSGAGIAVTHTPGEGSTASISITGGDLVYNNSVTLGTHTTGQYVGSLSVNSPIIRSGNAGPENATHNLSLDLTTDYYFQSEVKAKSYVDVHADIGGPAPGTNDYELNVSNSNSFKVSLALDADIIFQNVTTSATETMIWTVTIVQGSGPYTVTYPTNVHWPGGIKPTLSSANGAIDQFVFMKTGGSSNIYGFTVGQDIKAPASP